MFDFNLDVMSIAYVLVLAANLALILLVGNLTFERARDAWASVASRTRYLQSGLDQLRTAAEHAEAQTVEAAKDIAAAKQKLANAEVELAALKKRHAEEKPGAPMDQRAVLSGASRDPEGSNPPARAASAGFRGLPPRAGEESRRRDCQLCRSGLTPSQHMGCMTVR